jgi:hypothetical protein
MNPKTTHRRALHVDPDPYRKQVPPTGSLMRVSTAMMTMWSLSNKPVANLMRGDLVVVLSEAFERHEVWVLSAKGIGLFDFASLEAP